MPFLAVQLVADPKVPVDTTVGVRTDRTRTQSPPLPVLPVPHQPLGDHLAGGPLGGETLEPGQSHPGPAALHRVAVTPSTCLVNCKTFLQNIIRRKEIGM